MLCKNRKKKKQKNKNPKNYVARAKHKGWGVREEVINNAVRKGWRLLRVLLAVVMSLGFVWSEVGSY